MSLNVSLSKELEHSMTLIVLHHFEEAVNSFLSNGSFHHSTLGSNFPVTIPGLLGSKKPVPLSLPLERSQDDALHDTKDCVEMPLFTGARPPFQINTITAGSPEKGRRHRAD